MEDSKFVLEPSSSVNQNNYQMMPSTHPQMFFPPYQSGSCIQYMNCYFGNPLLQYPSHPFMMRDPNCSTPEMDGSQKKKSKFTPYQIERLRRRFAQHQHIKLPERKAFAESIGLTNEQVKIWFQNNRYILKKKASPPSSSPSPTREKKPDVKEEQTSFNNSEDSGTTSSSPTSPQSQADLHHMTPVNSQFTSPTLPFYSDPMAMGGQENMYYPQQPYGYGMMCPPPNGYAYP